MTQRDNYTRFDQGANELLGRLMVRDAANEP
jgi:hypothetical protein